MRFTIATKLFIGFLCVIGLNFVYIVIVNKIDKTNAIVDILRRQNEVKNRLLRLKTLHRVQGPSVISYEKIGRPESVENFRGINRSLVALIDTITQELDTIMAIDARLFPKGQYSPRQKTLLNTLDLVRTIASHNNSYSAQFETLVRISEPGRTFLPASGDVKVIDSINSIEGTITGELDSAESAITEQTNDRIRTIGGGITEVKNATIIILGGLTLFSILFGLIFSRTMTNSLRRLKEATTQIGKADFNINPSGFPDDETGDLATAFFDMAVDLRNKQEELFKSKRLAAIGEVIASVNHEINNPLMIISGNAQFLEMSMEGFSDDMKERVRTILEETERISQVTKKLREIRNPISQDYTRSGEQMINLDKSTT
jgi:methyl-accepting chemotaxis protein